MLDLGWALEKRGGTSLVSELHAMLCLEVYPGQVRGRLRCLRDASDEDLPPFRDKITPGGYAKVSIMTVNTTRPP